MPAVLEMHDRLTGKTGPLFFRWFLGYKTEKRILVITRALAEEAGTTANTKPFDPEIIRIAPNGVDLERYETCRMPPPPASCLDLPEKFTAVYTGHFYAGRGMDLLLQLAGNCRRSLSCGWAASRKMCPNWQTQVDAAGSEQCHPDRIRPQNAAAALPGRR